jgi:lipid II:glycine glycyltransferase (peptidoglycan interpeptide bridge formation enzyme)
MPYVYLPGYSEFCKKTSGGKLLFFADSNQNSMPCLSWKNKFLSFLQPLYPPLSPSGTRLVPSVEKTFLDEMIANVKNKKIADRISQSPAFAVFHSTPAESTRAPFGTYFIDLEQNNADQLSQRLHGKHRNVIRSAEKNHVEVKFGEDTLNDFYNLYTQTMSRAGMHCEPLSFFEIFLNELSGHSICGVAYYKHQPQGALLMPYTHFSAFYLYGASADKMEITGAMNYLHWQTILKLKEEGVKRYDFVGARLSANLSTKLKGIQQFKERFGSDLDRGYLWKKDIAPVKCRTYDKLLALKLGIKKQKIPLDIISQEINNYGKFH